MAKRKTAGISTERPRTSDQESSTFRLLVESAPNALVLVDRHGRIALVNTQAEKLFGYSRSELVGQSVEILVPEKARRVHVEFRATYQGNPTARPMGMGRDLYGIHKNGEQIPIEIGLNPFTLGRRHLVLASITDITARKQTEERMRLQAAILNQIHNAVISTDLAGRILYWNRFAETLYGWRSDEVIGRDAIEILVPPEQYSSAHARRRALEESGSWDGRTELQRKDGTRVAVHVYSALFRDEHGVPIGRNSVSVDISESLRVEQALQNAEQRYRSTLENMSEGCQIIDRTWRYVYVNEVAASHGRRRREELLGATMMEMYPGIEQTGMFEALRECMEAREHRRLQNEFRFPDGTTGWFDIRLEPVPEGVFILSTDITNEKRLSEELNQHREHLEELVAQRTTQLEAANKELEAFSYSVSHDLRAPLRAIDGFVRILDEEYGKILDAEASRLIGVIRSSTSNMAQLIDDLLRFSRTGRAELRKSIVDMKTLASAVVEELQKHSNGKPVSVTVGDLAPVQSDFGMMKVVFTNLISNAFKFTRYQPYPQIEIGFLPDAEEQVYFVKDNGAGFDQQYVDKLFGVFQRLHAKDEFEGTGIGLGIVKRIILRHDGRVWAEGKPGHGATFYFALPRSGESHA